GLRPRSGQRAWRVTGDYGSGKSSFALVLAHSLAGHDNAFPPQLRKAVVVSKRGIPQPQYLPVLVTCSRQSLSASILEGLHRSLSDVYKKHGRTSPVESVRKLLEAQAEPGDDNVLAAILHANSQVIADSKAQGLLLIIDEP